MSQCTIISITAAETEKFPSFTVYTWNVASLKVCMNADQDSRGFVCLAYSHCWTLNISCLCYWLHHQVASIKCFHQQMLAQIYQHSAETKAHTICSLDCGFWIYAVFSKVWTINNHFAKANSIWMNAKSWVASEAAVMPNYASVWHNPGFFPLLSLFFPLFSLVI